MLRMSQAQLATAADVSAKTIADYERESGRELHTRTLAAIRKALEDAGAVFIPYGDYTGSGAAGVRLALLAKPNPEDATPVD